MSSLYRTAYLTPDLWPAWDRLVDASQQGGLYNKSGFLRAFCAAGETRFKILGVLKGAELVGGVGLHYVPSAYGEIVHPRAGLYYNGVVLKDFATKYPAQATYRQLEILRRLLSVLQAPPYASVELSHRPPLTDVRGFLWNNWTVRLQYTYEVALRDLDLAWERVDQNLRRLIGRCERAGLTLKVDDDVAGFYRLYDATYARKGLAPALPAPRFEALYEALHAQGCAQIYSAVTPRGQTAASQIVLSSDHPVTHTWAAGTAAEHLNSGVSAFLRWKVFEELNRRGYASNDLTDALNESVARFKSQLGGQLAVSYVAARVNSAALRRRNKLYGNLIQPVAGLWRRLRARVGRSPKPNR